MKTLTLFVATLLITTPVLAKQKYYKWTDENGNTHYTSTKPEDRKTDEVNINANQPKAIQQIDANNHSEKPESVEGEVEKSYLEQRREKKQKAKELAQRNKKQCQKAKQTVTKYQQQVRMSRIDATSGEKVYLEDSKRADIIKKAQKEVNKYCR